MIYSKCRIISSEMLFRILKEKVKGTEAEAKLLRDIMVSERMRGRREVAASLSSMFPVGGNEEQIYIYDAHHSDEITNSTLVRKIGDQAVADNTVNEVFDSLDTTYKLYLDIYHRKSIDDNNMPLNGYVHWLSNFNNAFWDGSKMAYGDGDQSLFKSFTSAIDIGGHELTHGVTQYEAGLEYWCDSNHSPGAINESISDVYGSLVKQYRLGQSASQADWLIGQGIFEENPKWALRSMKEPGTASPYDNQPANFSDYNPGPIDEMHDEGGVHKYSSFGNHAFYLTAIDIGGNAWEKAGLIWYNTLGSGLNTKSSYPDFAGHTIQVARNLFGPESAELKAVEKAWNNVGVIIPPLII